MKKKIGIIGGGGYAAGELIRLLLQHPHAELSYVYSRSSGDKYISHVHRDLEGDTLLKFSESFHFDVDLIFLCMGHNHSQAFIEGNRIPAEVKVIDLSSDYRLDSSYVYGLPELNSALYGNKIANPGCFATAIELALLPLAKAKILKGEVHVNAITGATGAGQSLSSTTHFSWRNNNISLYKPFGHQHLAEIYSVLQEQGQLNQFHINFIPVRGPFSRGIFVSAYMDCGIGEADLNELYEKYYEAAPFTHVSHNEIDLKQVVNTNKCLLNLQKIKGKLLITSAIDNLLKGAAGQAVENMNLLLGLPQDTGLHLKAAAF